MRLANILLRPFAATWVLLVALPALAQSPAGTFTNFETGHVRPLAMSPDGSRLFAVNTPDNRLAIYDVTPGGLSLYAEVPVGMEPAAVAARTNTEAWVVNHLSDSISIVAVDPTPELSRVTRTLFTCDEPRDIVFAGPGGNRAFVSTARRGQNCPVPVDYETEGIGRAVVQVWDAGNLGAPLGGTPIANIVLFGDTPRGLAASADGSTVYASIFHSGNQTMTLTERTVTNNGGLPPPPGGALGGAPDVGLILKFNGLAWVDEVGTNWTPFVPFSLPDQDVFPIDANLPVPAALAGQEVTGVATTIFNLAVNPANGNLWVTNTEDHNDVRFEGHVFDGLHGVKGRIVESSITVVSGGAPVRHHLNPHINYFVSPGPESEIEQSSAFPTDLVFSSDGSRAYVAMLGSRHVAMFDSATLEGGTVAKTFIHTGGGPSGLALDEPNDRLYVLNRFDQRIGIVTNASDPALAAQTDTVALGDYDPQPSVVRKGRRHLYNAKQSGHGDNACASCHHFADQDDKAWDLGDAEATSTTANCNPFRAGSGTPFHPLKGPMTTQSLRGLANAGPMHWRGDRTGCSTGGNALDEEAAFNAFNPAFVGLLGNADQLPTGHMQEFTDFILTVRYPPNPIRDLDDVPTGPQASGETFYFNTNVDGGNTCNHCHRIDPAQDFFGTDGLSSTEGETQEFKIAHLRNQYQKFGMFGVPPGQSLVPPTGFLGDQVRGFGFLHDGSLATVNDFLSANVFNFPNATARRNVEAFVVSLETGLKPAVGQQVTLNAGNVGDAATLARLQLLLDQADAGNCDVIGKGEFSGEARGVYYIGFGTNRFLTDRTSEGSVPVATLLGLISPGQEATYSCVPVGAGIRMGIDRDGDDRRDRDELDAGSDPNDPTSFPGSTPHVPISTKVLKMKDRTDPPTPTKRKLTFTSKDPAIVAPAGGSVGDPTANGGTLRVYNANGSGEQVTIDLPAGNWFATSSGYKFKGLPNGAVQVVILKDGLVKIKAGKSNFDYTLDEPKQGRMAVRLTLGTGVDWCAEAQAKQKGSPASTDKFDKVDKFQSEKNAPAPAGCPVPPLGSPSGAFVDGMDAGLF